MKHSLLSLFSIILYLSAICSHTSYAGVEDSLSVTLKSDFATFFNISEKERNTIDSNTSIMYKTGGFQELIDIYITINTDSIVIHSDLALDLLNWPEGMGKMAVDLIKSYLNEFVTEDAYEGIQPLCTKLWSNEGTLEGDLADALDAILGKRDQKLLVIGSSVLTFGYDENKLLRISIFKGGGKNQQAAYNSEDASKSWTDLNQQTLQAFQQGEYSQALEWAKKTLAQAQKEYGKKSDYYASGLNNLGEIYRVLGEYKNAEKHLNNAIQLFSETKGSKDVETIDAINNLGTLYKQMGMYPEAHDKLDFARKIRKEQFGELHEKYSESLSNLATVYDDLGNYKQAETYYLQSLKIEESIDKYSLQYAITANNVANLYRKMGKVKQAFPYSSESVLVFYMTLGKEHPNYARAVNTYASLYHTIEEYDTAAMYYEESREILKKVLGEKHPEYIASLNNLAVLYSNMEDYDKAIPSYNEALQLVKKTKGTHHPEYAQISSSLANMYFEIKDYKKAGEHYKVVNQKFLKHISSYFPAMNEKEQRLFYESIKPKINEFNVYVLERWKEQPELLNEAYDNWLATKGLTINTLSKLNTEIAKSNDEALIGKYEEWVSLRNKLLHSVQEGESTAHAMSKKLEDRADQIEKELMGQFNIFSNTKTIRWKDIQKQLAPKEAAIEIIRVKSKYALHYIALLISTDTEKHPQLILLDNAIKMEGEYFDMYKNSTSSDYEIEDETSYNAYWSLIAKELKGIQKVYISLDGIYHKISLNALKNTTSEQFILDEIDLRIVGSTKDIMAYKKQHKKGKPQTESAELFGRPDYHLNQEEHQKVIEKHKRSFSTSASSVSDWYRNIDAANFSDLAGTEKEVEDIYKILEKQQWTVNRYLGKDALEEAVKAVNNPTVLHIATHGYFLDTKENPLDGQSSQAMYKSGIILAGANYDYNDVNYSAENGFLTAYEASHLKLNNTDLVVLSACETGLGEIKDGEGVYGLQRAFLVAGTKSLIFSLWKVDDQATQKLMTSFYQNWIATGDKRTAFRKSQQLLKEEYPEPYYWGAFVMIGE